VEKLQAEADRRLEGYRRLRQDMAGMATTAQSEDRTVTVTVEPSGTITDLGYDLGDLGHGTLHGLDELRTKALEIGVQNPIGHHVTNIVLTEEDHGRVRAKSKAMGIQRDGTTGSVVYEDLLRLTPAGWRIVHRVIRRTESGRHGV
jgi:hypothetical protein